MRSGVRILDRRVEKLFVSLQEAMDGDALVKTVFRLLRKVTSCDFVNVFLRIVRQGNAEVALRIMDSRGVEPVPDSLREALFRDHPGMPKLLANPGIRFINTRDVLPPEEVLRGTRFYREVMQVLGFRHAAALFFWDDPPTGPLAVFSICRAENRPDFDDAELAVLDQLYPHIQAAVRRVAAIEQERAIRHDLHLIGYSAPRAVCILDWELRVAEANRAARESCARWNLVPPHLKAPPFELPAEVREACLALQVRWRGSPANAASPHLTVAHPRLAEARAIVTLHPHASGSLERPTFRVEFTDAAPARLSPRRTQAGLPDTLSERERLLVRLVCEGRTNQEIATETGRALGSVKNALHIVFKKLQVRSRSGLAAALARSARVY